MHSNTRTPALAARRTALALGVALAAPAAVVSAQSAPDTSSNATPYELMRRKADEPSWAPLLRLRAAASRFERDTVYGDAWRQVLAQAEGTFGNYERALRTWDLSARRSNSDTAAATIATRAAFQRARRVSARDTLVAIADTARVIMINERHHAASDRLLTLELLPVLWAKGFRYFAAEAFDAAALEPTGSLTARGYALDDDGYTSEPVFAEIVREAKRLGYTLVPYEATGTQFDQPDSLTSQQRRDYWQAANLAAATVARDSTAKVLVHVGFSHLRERVVPGWSPMAAYFTARTGINPVTVDQTVLTDRSTPLVGHPVQMAMRGALPSTNTVFVREPSGDGGAPAAFEAATIGVDLTVARAPVSLIDGRPAYLTMGGRRRAERVAVPECANRHCVIAAHIASEPDSATVLDRAEAERVGQVTLFLPNSPVRLTLYAASGERLRSWVRGAR
jgi:hypothetical protein